MTRIFRKQGDHASTFHIFGDKGSHSVGTVHAPTGSYDASMDAQETSGKLFTEYNVHGPKMHYMTSTAGPAHIGALVGMAANESRSRWGYNTDELEPSDDLSAQSGPIVDKLFRKGAIKKGYRAPGERPGINHMDKTHAERDSRWAEEDLKHHDAMAGEKHQTEYSALGEELPPHVFTAGANTFKQVAFGDRPSKPNAGPQFTQGQLPGF